MADPAIDIIRAGMRIAFQPTLAKILDVNDLGVGDPEDLQDDGGMDPNISSMMAGKMAQILLQTII
jgi:hypothetical protein